MKIFVGNLNPKSKPEDLRRKFEFFGKVTECVIVNDYGFVHMEKDADGLAAIKGLQNCMLDGFRINVEHSHGRRSGDGGGPMRRRDERFHPGPYPPYSPRFMNAGLSPSRNGRFGPGWDNRFCSPFRPFRDDMRDFDYFPCRVNGRYIRDRDYGQPMVRLPPREMMPHTSEFGFRNRMPSPPRKYAKPPMMHRSGYRGYGEYERFHESPSGPRPHGNDGENYGSYSSGPNYDEYWDGERPFPYDNGGDHNYQGYAGDRRNAPPSYPVYSYGYP